MKKEITKMYVKAIGKVLFALLLGALLVLVMKSMGRDEIVAVVVCSILWGLVVIVYLFTGIRTIIKGAWQVKDYLASSHYTKMQLEEEYNSAQKFGGVRIGRVHVFANASDQFYIVPLTNLREVRITQHGRNRLGRAGYYYLRMKAEGISKEFKVYYISKKKPQEVLEAIRAAATDAKCEEDVWRR